MTFYLEALDRSIDCGIICPHECEWEKDDYGEEGDGDDGRNGGSLGLSVERVPGDVAPLSYHLRQGEGNHGDPKT